MLKKIRSHLERWGLLTPLYDRMTLRGAIWTDAAAERIAFTDAGTLLSVCIGDGQSTLFPVAADGRFHLELPLDQLIRLTIARQGHLPRMLEIQPLRSRLRMARNPLHVSCAVEVTLTPRLDADGQAMRPLRERVTMPAYKKPLIAEWDHVMHAERREEFVPLFARSG